LSAFGNTPLPLRAEVLYQSINQSFICIRPMVHIKEEKKK